MSIYPVRLKEWFSLGDEHYEIVQAICNVTRCKACGNKVRYSKSVGHHSLPFGHGDLWCSWECCKSGKVARIDKRRQRRYNRQIKTNELLKAWLFELTKEND